MMCKLLIVLASIVLMALFANAFYNASSMDSYTQYTHPNRPYVAGSP